MIDQLIVQLRAGADTLPADDHNGFLMRVAAEALETHAVPVPAPLPLRVEGEIAPSGQFDNTFNTIVIASEPEKPKRSHKKKKPAPEETASTDQGHDSDWILNA